MVCSATFCFLLNGCLCWSSLTPSCFLLVFGRWLIKNRLKLLYQWVCTCIALLLYVSLEIPAVQYIVVVAFIILLDIVQLGLFFPDQQRANGRGDSKYCLIVRFKLWLYSTLCISCAGQLARTWQFSAAYPHTLFSPQYYCTTILILFPWQQCPQLCDNEPAIQGDLSTVSLLSVSNNVLVFYSRFPLLLLAWCCTFVPVAVLAVSVGTANEVYSAP